MNDSGRYAMVDEQSKKKPISSPNVEKVDGIVHAYNIIMNKESGLNPPRLLLICRATRLCAAHPTAQADIAVALLKALNDMGYMK